jgi:hypothetical protein
MSLHNFLATCLDYADPEFQERHVSLPAVDGFAAPHAPFSPEILQQVKRFVKDASRFS